MSPEGEPGRGGAPEPGEGGAPVGAGAPLWRRVQAPFGGRVDVLEDAVAALVAGTLGDELRRTAEREAHRLVGSAGTFGFPRASRLARELELALEGPVAPEPADAPRLAELVLELRRDLEQGERLDPARVAALGVPPTSGRRHVLVVEPEREFGGALVAELEARGLDAELAAGADPAWASLAAGAPDAVVLDLELGGVRGAGQAALALLEALAALRPRPPVLVVTGRTEFGDRVEVARLSGRAFLRKPVPAGQVAEAVKQMLAGDPGRATRVLVVDDDLAQLLMVEAVLRAAGMAVITLGDPLRFWEVLEESAPDVLVLDLDLPSITGLELCRIVRGDARWGTVPVIVVTVHTDAATVARVFEAGADDYVPKPVLGPELVTRIRNRLERNELHRRLAETDPLTGVTNRRRAEELLEEQIAAAERYRQPVALALLDVDELKAVNDRFGHALGDRILERLGKALRRSFGAGDVTARWTGGQFVVGMPGLTLQDGVHRIAGLLERLRADPLQAGGEDVTVTFSAAVAQYPADGADLHALYRAAERSLRAAKLAGRDQVVPAGWAGGALPRLAEIDVLLVEDDVALGELLRHALETRGYRVEWLKDGLEAARALGGTEATLQARLALLDVGLPGLDGLSVLRQWQREGVLVRTRVIVLTARSAESEVLAALESGASDHVAKPFSVPVLMQRVQRALEAGG